MTDLSKELEYTCELHDGYPTQHPDSCLRFWCPDAGEYIQSSAFGDNDGLHAVWSQPAGISTALTLLTIYAHGLNYTTPYSGGGFEMRGRWSNKRIISAYPYGSIRKRQRMTDWGRSENDTDISHLVVQLMERRCRYIRDLKPRRLRRLIYGSFTPTTSDFTWLHEGQLERLQKMCHHHREGTWLRMRVWLLRQQLSDDARRALKGRPGRLLRNQQRKQVLLDGRGARRINTKRKKGGGR